MAGQVPARVVLVSGRRATRHRVGWFVRERGNPNQSPGRHTPEYVAANGRNLVGMYPHGQAMRVPHVPWDGEQCDQLDRLNNDPHQRYRLDELMPSAAR